MKGHWLRGMLLGVSLALLLAGGAALAQGLTVTPDQDCFECKWMDDGDANASYTPSPYGVELTLTGHQLGPGDVCTAFTVNDNPVDEYCLPAPDISPAYGYLFASCSEEWNIVGFRPFGHRIMEGQLIVAIVVPAFEYGEWLLHIEQEGIGSDHVSVTLAEECPEEVEFVPEPGTLALLGSGLASLAGYGALRWRARS